MLLAITADSGRLLETAAASDTAPLSLGSEASQTLNENDVIQEYCVRCHSDRRLRGNLSLESFDADQPHLQGDVGITVQRSLTHLEFPCSGARGIELTQALRGGDGALMFAEPSLKLGDVRELTRLLLGRSGEALGHLVLLHAHEVEPGAAGAKERPRQAVHGEHHERSPERRDEADRHVGFEHQRAIGP